ncbi:histidine phosphatase family protein [Vibrio marisflavi]|uniref:2,3-bisphosphoglycerate-dependent phosphoglycerate mutase n=1 Tax=Vibrio marisflavi CECT 7928 TaxID=634439 RepID=A0ABN8E5N0_9VIBR|nr:histidine phosphatase family protein [Vibrio marisflavi]CAH0538976.1 2,3-bisphosphoglycerate-dependent phosphoglycerate mutase [Vibrio marisflavi CECT 7928]
MTTRLIIARHGNTFLPSQTPTRVGARTDLDLVESARSEAVGNYLKQNNLLPDVVLSGPLKRHKQTADIICSQVGFDASQVSECHFLNEIDYGPDENKPEQEVMSRLGAGNEEKGKAVIDNWNQNAIVPDGWLVDPNQLKKEWVKLAQHIADEYSGKTALLVSSNGLMRFSNILDTEFEYQSLKVPTGGICIFEYDESGDKQWRCMSWAVKPAS